MSHSPRNRTGTILMADVIFLFAIFMITRTLELQMLDILMIGLVVLSLVVLAYQYFAKPGDGLATVLTAVQ